MAKGERVDLSRSSPWAFLRRLKRLERCICREWECVCLKNPPDAEDYGRKDASVSVKVERHTAECGGDATCDGCLPDGELDAELGGSDGQEEVESTRAHED